MPDRRSVIANSTTFFNEWNGRAKFSHALTDGTILFVTVTYEQVLLLLSQQAEFVRDETARRRGAQTPVPETAYQA